MGAGGEVGLRGYVEVIGGWGRFCALFLNSWGLVFFWSERYLEGYSSFIDEELARGLGLLRSPV